MPSGQEKGNENTMERHLNIIICAVGLVLYGKKCENFLLGRNVVGNT